MGVTRFSSQIKCTEATAKYGEVVIPWQRMLQRFSTANAALSATGFGTGTSSSTKLALNTSNLGALGFASTDVINFLQPLPYDFDGTAASYLDIYTMAGADSLATKGEGFNFAVKYTAATPISSGTAAGDSLGATFSSAGITQPTRWTVHTAQIAGRLFKQTATIAADTLTEGDHINFKLTAALTGTEFDYGIQYATLRYVRDFV